MTTPKHTPGPWLFGGGCVETDGSPHSDRRTVIAQMISARYAGTVTAPGECEANGRLIAAAPDLLAALRLAQDILAGHAPHTVGDEHQIAAALAKAGGQS